MTPEQEAAVSTDLEQLRSVLGRLVAVRVSPDGPMLDQHEGSIMISFGTLMFLASDLRETRLTASKKLRAENSQHDTARHHTSPHDTAPHHTPHHSTTQGS